MNAKDRRKFEMGRRALKFSEAHPDPSPGFTAAIAQLKNAIERGEGSATRERDGHRARRAGTVAILAEALAHKELLVRHGLADTVLDGVVEAIAQFDAALDLAAEGHQAHVGASAELSAIADEILQIVRGMDGLNRYRFRNDAELLAAWESASNVVSFARSDKAAPEVKPRDAASAAQSRPAA